MIEKNNPFGERRNKIDTWTNEFGITQFKKIVEEYKTKRAIATAMNIHRNTLLEWLNKSPDLYQAFLEASTEVHKKVEQNMYERANGITYTEEHYEFEEMTKAEYKRRVDLEMAIFERDNPDADELDKALHKQSISKYKKVKKKEVTKFIPPDVSSQRFILTNRKPDEWKDKQHVVETHIEPELTADQKEKLGTQYMLEEYGDLIDENKASEYD